MPASPRTPTVAPVSLSPDGTDIAPPVDDLPFYLAGLYHSFRGLLERTRMDSGLHQSMVSPGMGSIFLLLCQEDDCIIKQLVERLKIPNATLTGLLDRMEAGGIIERHPCPDDGRAFRVRLTSFGRSLEAGMQQRHQLATQILQHGLSKTEVSDLKRLLGRVLGNLHRDEAAWRLAQKAERAQARAERFAQTRRPKQSKAAKPISKPTANRGSL